MNFGFISSIIGSSYGVSGSGSGVGSSISLSGFPGRGILPGNSLI